MTTTEDFTFEIDGDEVADHAGIDKSKAPDKVPPKDVDPVDSGAVPGKHVDVDKADDPLDHLKQQFAALNGKIDQIRIDSQQSQHAAQTELQHGKNIDLLETGIRNEVARADQAQANLAAALQSNNYEAAAIAQRAMTEATNNITQMRTGLETLKERNSPESIQRQQVAPKSHDEAIEGVIGQYSGPAQKWLRLHRADIFSNPNRARLAQSAHDVAVAKGLAPDSDEYFKSIDETMGYAKAPQSRGNAAPSSGQSISGKRTVTLTRDEMQHCKDMGQDPKEYARAKARIESGESNLRFRSAK